MLLDRAGRRHPQLDFDAMCRLFERTTTGRNLTGQFITSPFDLYSVETLRDLHRLRVGAPVATDVIVFGLGEPARAGCTKVGGMPCWPERRPWPSQPGGAPYRFLAQFDFRDSADLFETLPGHVLLLLVPEGDDWLWEPQRIRFEWIDADDGAVSARRDVPAACAAGPFFGVIHRSADYPAAVEATLALEVSQAWTLPILHGTKIGGRPAFIQSEDAGDHVFLCQLGSIQAAPAVPFPWANRERPLTLAFSGPDGIYAPELSISFGDMGSIYCFLDRAGSVHARFECA